MSNSLRRIINNLIRINRRQIDRITIHIIMVQIDIYGITNSIIIKDYQEPETAENPKKFAAKQPIDILQK